MYNTVIMLARDVFRLLRAPHYIKNGLILLPLFFNLDYSPDSALTAVIGFLLFSLVASVVYIINDINDIEDDRRHPKKKYRPLASGAISIQSAWIIAAIIMTVVVVIAFAYPPITPAAGLVLAAYALLNIGYSLRLKHVPIIDIFILATGFVLRIIFGAVIFDITLSNWLILTVLCASLFMGIGKRRNELTQSKKTRKVNRYYSFNFLNNSLYVFLALTICFYSLWSIDAANQIHNAIWTIPVVILILMSYGLKLESDTCDGDPVNVLLGDKSLSVLTLLYSLMVVTLVIIQGMQAA